MFHIWLSALISLTLSEKKNEREREKEKEKIENLALNGEILHEEQNKFAELGVYARAV